MIWLVIVLFMTCYTNFTLGQSVRRNGTVCIDPPKDDHKGLIYELLIESTEQKAKLIFNRDIIKKKKIEMKRYVLFLVLLLLTIY